MLSLQPSLSYLFSVHVLYQLMSVTLAQNKVCVKILHTINVCRTYIVGIANFNPLEFYKGPGPAGPTFWILDILIEPAQPGVPVTTRMECDFQFHAEGLEASRLYTLFFLYDTGTFVFLVVTNVGNHRKYKLLCEI